MKISHWILLYVIGVAIGLTVAKIVAMQAQSQINQTPLLKAFTAL